MSNVCVLSGAVVRLWRVISQVAGSDGGVSDALRTVRATVPVEEGAGGGGSGSGGAASGANNAAAAATTAAAATAAAAATTAAAAAAASAPSRTIVGVRFPANKIPLLRLALERADLAEMAREEEGGGDGGEGGAGAAAGGGGGVPLLEGYHDDEEEDEYDDEFDDDEEDNRGGGGGGAARGPRGLQPPPPPERPAPVDPARLRRLTQPPRTILSMFAAAPAAALGRGGGRGGGGRGGGGRGGGGGAANRGVGGAPSGETAADLRKRKRQEEAIDTIMTVTLCSYAVAEEALRRAHGDSGRAVVLVLEGEVGQ